MKKMLVMALALIMIISSVCAFAEQAELEDDVLLAKTSLTTGLEKTADDTIMVAQMDNEPNARPQMGIGSADIVYEIELYNGGYTRYTAVFNDTIPEKIEAIRSTRMVNVDFYLDYGGCFIHWGGQNMAGSNVYDYMDKVGMQAHYDGISDGSGNFYRDNSREQPWNVVCKLSELSADVDWSKTNQRSPLKFSADSYTVQGDDVAEFSVEYRDSYKPSYVYNAEDGLYYRYYNGNEYKDGVTGEQITCSNVIVQYVGYSWYDGASDRPIVTTTGTNKCEYFIGGKHFTGYWERDSVENNTVYYDDAGNEVTFKAGKTYIQTLKDTKEVTIAQ
jgi:hypothetical protein